MRRPQGTRGNHKVSEETITLEEKNRVYKETRVHKETIVCMETIEYTSKTWSTCGNHRVHEKTIK